MTKGKKHPRNDKRGKAPSQWQKKKKLYYDKKAPS